MGIKNIHILLICAAAFIAFIFGIWGLSHQFTLLGIAALAFAFGMIVYGVQFLKKVKTL